MASQASPRLQNRQSWLPNKLSFLLLSLESAAIPKPCPKEKQNRTVAGWDPAVSLHWKRHNCCGFLCPAHHILVTLLGCTTPNLLYPRPQDRPTACLPAIQVKCLENKRERCKVSVKYHHQYHNLVAELLGLPPA